MSQWLSRTAQRSIPLAYGELGAKWVANIDQVVRDAEAHFEVCAEAVLSGGALSSVIRCTARDGTPCVLKLSCDLGPSVEEAAALTAWAATDPTRVVHVYGSIPGAILLAQVTPGDAYSPSFNTHGNPDPAQLDELAEILGMLAGTPATNVPGLLSLESALEDRRDAVYDRLSTTGVGTSVEPRRVRDMCDAVLNVFATRVAELDLGGTSVVCHGDLWANNILTSHTPHREGHLVLIDPMPRGGPLASDIAFFCVCAQWGQNVPAWINGLCARLGIDVDDVWNWVPFHAADRLGVAVLHDFDLANRLDPLGKLVLHPRS